MPLVGKCWLLAQSYVTGAAGQNAVQLDVDGTVEVGDSQCDTI